MNYPAIAAIATPPGKGSISVIRVSGDEVITKINQIFKPTDLAHKKGYTIHYGHIIKGDYLIDKVLVSLFRQPYSYTGEDVVEISCHGGILVTQEVLRAILSMGVRVANPGEFTQRAFLNGKMDLGQVEAVAELIQARSKKAVLLAQQHLSGKLKKHIDQFQQQLVEATGLLELELDFSEEDVEFIDKKSFAELITTLIDKLKLIVNTHQQSQLIREGISVALVGSPNSGKSTLLNAFLNQDRAIVSDIAGTTRDTIEAEWGYQGFLFKLIDTAGIRQDSRDYIEKIGIQRTLQSIKKAHIILYLKDLSVEWQPNEASFISSCQQHKPCIVIGTKQDLVDKKIIISPIDITISALKGQGLKGLYDRMIALVLDCQTKDEDAIMLVSERQYHALSHILEHLYSARTQLKVNQSQEIIALDLHSALRYMGEITGTVSSESVLNSIFSRFCIGK